MATAEEFYRLNDPQTSQGICLIISNETFIRNPKRTGALFDVAHLTDTFERLNFSVETKQNLTADGMLGHLTEVAHRRDHSAEAMFVCCILSHGQRNEVIGTDDRGVDIERILNCVETAESLKGKPKLFFIQACQDYNPNVEMDSVTSPAETIDTWAENLRTDMLPEGSDMFLGMSTIPGKESYRTKQGTWFIIHLCAAIDEFVGK